MTGMVFDLLSAYSLSSGVVSLKLLCSEKKMIDCHTGWQSLASQDIIFSLCKRSLHKHFVSRQFGDMKIGLKVPFKEKNRLARPVCRGRSLLSYTCFFFAYVLPDRLR
jgi:hypothetical protein